MNVINEKKKNLLESRIMKTFRILRGAKEHLSKIQLLFKAKIVYDNTLEREHLQRITFNK